MEPTHIIYKRACRVVSELYYTGRFYRQTSRRRGDDVTAAYLAVSPPVVRYAVPQYNEICV